MVQQQQTKFRKGRQVLARSLLAGLAVAFGALSLAVLQPAATTSAATTNGRIYTGYSTITSRNPNGTDVKMHANYTYALSQYSFSPDGKKIAYMVSQSTNSTGLVVANADMTGAVTIKSNIAEALNQDGPSWSPDGQWLAYGTHLITPTQGGSTWTGYINLVKPDGTGSRVLPGITDRVSNLSWVNATSLLYQNTSANSCVVSTATSAKNCSPTGVLSASYATLLAAPNGTQMAWLKTNTAQGANATTDLYVSNLDGTNARRLTTLPAGQSVQGFAWAPDATSLAVLIYTRANGQVANIALGLIQKDTGSATILASGAVNTLDYNQLADRIAWQPVVVASPAPTPTPTPTPTPVPTTAGGAAVTSQYGGRCLDLDANGAGASGSKVQLWGCSGGANQRWSLMADGTVRAHYGSNLCLDVDTNGGGVDGNKVQAWACSGASNQRWTRTAAGELRSQYASRCLDVDTNGGGNDGNKVQLWGCSGGSNQKWNFAADPNVTNVVLQSQYTNRCLDAQPSGGGNGNVVYIWDCHGGTNQRWTLNANGTISAGYGGRCLDAELAGGGNGNRVYLWDCHGGSNQRWTRTANGSLQSQYSGRCLDVDPSSNGANGSRVYLWDCHGGSNQRWTVLQ